RVVSETLQGQLEELERAAAHLQELCPTRLCPVSREPSLCVGSRFQPFPVACGAEEGLSHFSGHPSCAHSSWTEDTRAQIFSESSSGHGLPETPCEELERRIEGKLEEFEALA
ncbi:hypothetical protein N340_06717, partial [Tauraco erythrolophus]